MNNTELSFDCEKLDSILILFSEFNRLFHVGFKLLLLPFLLSLILFESSFLFLLISNLIFDMLIFSLCGVKKKC